MSHGDRPRIVDVVVYLLRSVAPHDTVREQRGADPVHQSATVSGSCVAGDCAIRERHRGLVVEDVSHVEQPTTIHQGSVSADHAVSEHQSAVAVHPASLQRRVAQDRAVRERGRSVEGAVQPAAAPSNRVACDHAVPRGEACTSSGHGDTAAGDLRRRPFFCTPAADPRAGYAAAVAWILFLMIFGVTIINWRYGGKLVQYS